LAFFSVLGVAASGYSLQFLSFPTWVLFKSSRVVFVMFGGIIMLKKRYSPLEYFSVALLAMGLVLFTVVDVAKSPNFHPIGIALVLLALVSDAMLGNIQERIFQRYKSVSKQEMVMYSFGLGSAFIFAWLLAFSRTELMVGSRFLMEHPTIFGASIVR
jgi:adenosine 3'-phospho 5'-phosphosulfate transporter B3